MHFKEVRQDTICCPRILLCFTHTAVARGEDALMRMSQEIWCLSQSVKLNVFL